MVVVIQGGMIRNLCLVNEMSDSTSYSLYNHEVPRIKRRSIGIPT